MIAEYPESVNIRIPKEVKVKLQSIAEKKEKPISSVARLLLMEAIQSHTVVSFRDQAMR